MSNPNSLPARHSGVSETIGKSMLCMRNLLINWCNMILSIIAQNNFPINAISVFLILPAPSVLRWATMFDVPGLNALLRSIEIKSCRRLHEAAMRIKHAGNRPKYASHNSGPQSGSLIMEASDKVKSKIYLMRTKGNPGPFLSDFQPQRHIWRCCTGKQYFWIAG